MLRDCETSISLLPLKFPWLRPPSILSSFFRILYVKVEAFISIDGGGWKKTKRNKPARETFYPNKCVCLGMAHIVGKGKKTFMQHKKKEKDENWAIWAASFSRHPRFASSYHVWKSFVGERRQKRIFLAEIFFSPVLTPFYQKKWRKEKLIVESYYAFSFKIFPLRCLMEGKFICTRLLREPLFVVNSGGLWRWRRLIVHSA